VDANEVTFMRMNTSPSEFSPEHGTMVDAALTTLGETTTLANFLRIDSDLTLEERRRIVDQALRLIEQVYVHLPFKRAMHAVDPVQRLRLLRQHLGAMSTRQFHDEMIATFTQLRDLHTNYLLPNPFRTKTAFLPFLIEEFFAGDTRHYLVSKLFPGFSHRYFKAGVVVTHWNGIPIDRAVELNADRQAGSNEAARHARGLDTLTTRPMILTAPPDEEWVVIGYTDEEQDRELRIAWQIFEPDPSPNRVDPNSLQNPTARALGIDAQTEAIQRAKKILFAPTAMEAEKQVAALRGHGASEPAGAGLGSGMADVSTLPNVFSFRTVHTPHGDFGYIRIWNFQVNDADDLVSEFIRIAGLLPQTGLIIDIRGNPGGVITAGELLLQVLTPQPIDPERLHFINTPLTLELCERDSFLSQWKASIAQSVETAATYSNGFPLHPVESYNRLGQRYYGPVVLITDALCYSTADIFTAGFQDHGIGPILGTSGNTGAGGANVWTHELLRQVLLGPTSPFQSLPYGASFRVAIRRTTRVGTRSGTPVEDLGTVPDYLHRITKNDLLNRNEDLIVRAAQLLVGLPMRGLSVVVTPQSGGIIRVSATTKNISRLDIFLNERPVLTRDVRDGTTTLVLRVSPPGTGRLELRGFDDGQLVAVKRIVLQRQGHHPHHGGIDMTEEPKRHASPQEVHDLVTRLHDDGVLNLDTPMRAFLDRDRRLKPSGEESWYIIVGSLLVLPQ